MDKTLQGFKIPTRVVMVIMMHLALQSSFNLRVVLNVAMVEMVEKPKGNNSNENYEPACPNFPEIVTEQKGEKYPWPSSTESLVLYSFFIGYMVSQIPGGWLADKYGGRWLLFLCVFFSTIFTVLFPYFTSLGGYKMAVLMRFLFGVSQGPIFPTISSLVSFWIPPTERTLLGGITYGGTNLGNILGILLTGQIIYRFGNWEWAFYIWSMVACGYMVLHLIYVWSSPRTSPLIDEKEKRYLEKFIASSKPPSTPWKLILKNIPFWANTAAQFAHNWIFFTLNTYLPTYMKDILRFNIVENTIVTSLPPATLWMCTLILSASGQYLINTLGIKPHTFSKVFSTISNVGAGACLLAAVYIGCDRSFAVGFYVVAMVFKSFYYMTLPTNINELSSNYAGTMYAICNVVCSSSGLFGNLLIGLITKNRRLFEWQICFWITFGITVVTSIVYIIWSSGERQPFDYPKERSKDCEPLK